MHNKQIQQDGRRTIGEERKGKHQEFIYCINNSIKAPVGCNMVGVIPPNILELASILSGSNSEIRKEGLKLYHEQAKKI